MHPSNNSASEPVLPPVPSAASDQPQPSAAPPVPGQPLPPATNVAAAPTPDKADDGDIIEKAWVMKVKQAMHATAHDPYEQNKQFTQIKAEYMQKRYGKIIKSDD